MSYTSSGQFGQDRFPYTLMPAPYEGTFVDIGCGDPVSCNNSYGLEQVGWKGLCMDCIPGCVDSHKVRKSRFALGDARNFPWLEEFQKCGFKDAIDYLSLDVDDLGLEVMKTLPFDSVFFCTMTIEHDAYRIGNGMRDAMREFLQKRGYKLVCSDVCWNGGLPLEDWWVHRGIFTDAELDPLRCDRKEWSDIFK